jgi:charged multivesicular body protein 2A
MAWLFGRQKTPAEVMKEHSTVLGRTQRRIDRERATLETDEKELITKIRNSANRGQIESARSMALNLVRMRNQIKKLHQLHAQIDAVKMQINSMRTTVEMAEAMRGVTGSMRTANRQINLPQLQQILMDFERQTMAMDMKQDIMNDTMQSVQGGDDDEQESNDIIDAVMDEIGISVCGRLANVPPAAVRAPPSAPRVPRASAAAAAAVVSSSSSPSDAARGGSAQSPAADAPDPQLAALEQRLLRLNPHSGAAGNL